MLRRRPSSASWLLAGLVFILPPTSRADDIPSYTLIDLGSDANLGNSFFETQNYRQGYVTSLDGNSRYAFNRTSTFLDVYGSSTPQFNNLPLYQYVPKGFTPTVWMSAENSQGVVLGQLTATNPNNPASTVWHTFLGNSHAGTSSLVDSVSPGQATPAWDSAMGYQFNDVNKNGVTVGSVVTAYWQIQSGGPTFALRSDFPNRFFEDGFIDDTKTNQSYDLNKLVPSTTAWHISTAEAIDDDGRILATGFTGNGPTGQVHELLLVPDGVALTVPEPSTFVLMGLGFVAVLGALSRRGASRATRLTSVR